MLWAYSKKYYLITPQIYKSVGITSIFIALSPKHLKSSTYRPVSALAYSSQHSQPMKQW